MSAYLVGMWSKRDNKSENQKGKFKYTVQSLVKLFMKRKVDQLSLVKLFINGKVEKEFLINERVRDRGRSYRLDAYIHLHR